MKVSDPSTPDRASYQWILINVNRNVWAPTFGQDTYFETIGDDAGKGYTVIIVNATDEDGVSPIIDILFILYSETFFMYLLLNGKARSSRRFC